MTTRLRLGASALVTALGVALCGCTAGSSAIVVSGTVDATLATVTAPTLTMPSVNLDAGFTTLTGPRSPMSGRTVNATSSVASTLGAGTTVRVARVLVAEGDTVKAGQDLVVLDTRAQKAQLAAAKADADVAVAQVGVLAAAIDTTFDKEADVNDAKDKVVDAIGKVRSGITTVRKKMAQGRKQLAAAKKALAAVNAQIAALPPGVPVPPALQDAHDKLVAGIKAGTAGLKKAAGILKQLKAGLSKARSGLRKINDGLANLADARGNLRDLKELAVLQASAARVPVDAARVQLSTATLTAPVDGVVVSVAHTGMQLAPLATVVSIRQAQPSTVTAWLSPSQLDRVCPGDAALVTGDWMTDGSGVRATLTRISDFSEYPPTSTSTEEVHLTRAVEVEFTATEQLPAGVPVELSIQGCHTGADNTDPNR